MNIGSRITVEELLQLARMALLRAGLVAGPS